MQAAAALADHDYLPSSDAAHFETRAGVMLGVAACPMSARRKQTLAFP
jgi:hypothetical protein